MSNNIYIYTMFTYIHWNGPPMMVAENGGEQFMDYMYMITPQKYWVVYENI